MPKSKVRAYATELSRYIHLNPVRAKIAETPESYPWMSYRCYTEGAAPSWLTTGFILGYFGKNAMAARENYRHFVHDLIRREYSSPLQGAVASTILGGAEFVSEIYERHLLGRKTDRDQSALREFNDKPSLDVIVQVVSEVFAVNDRQAKKAGIYLCHRYSGAKLREIGELSA